MTSNPDYFVSFGGSNLSKISGALNNGFEYIYEYY